MQAVILAGGKGTRLRPLTLYTPKPTMPLVGQPFLAYQLDLLRRAGISDAILSLSYQPQKIEDTFGDGARYEMRLRYLVEPQPLGTAGAYRNAKESLDSPTIVFNGDILTEIDLNKVKAFHDERKAVATIVLTPVHNPSIYGLVVTGEDGRVEKFIEKPRRDAITTNTINAGIYILDPEVLKYIPSGESYSFEYDLFPALAEKGLPVYGFVSDEYWIDIGTPTRYLQANLDLIAGRLPQASFERFERNPDAARAVIDTMSWIHPTARIKPGAEIVNSVIEPNCIVEEKAVIKNTVLRRSTFVGQEATIRNSVAGSSCHVGRYSYVDSAILGDKTSLTDYTSVGEAQ